MTKEIPQPENIAPQIKPVEGKPGLFAFDRIEHDQKMSAEINEIINNAMFNNPIPIEKPVIDRLFNRIKISKLLLTL